MLKYVIILIWSCLAVQSAKQKTDSLLDERTREVQYDLESRQKRVILDEGRIEKFKNNKDFDYKEYEESDTWWSQFKRWLGNIISDFLKGIFGSGITDNTLYWILTILKYLVIIGVLFFLGWLFMNVSPRSMFSKFQQKDNVLMSEDQEIIENQDISELIEKALQDKNYRLAIRYYYLSVLKKMMDAELIHWESQKTNRDYYAELQDPLLKKKFSIITRIYDFIWYGSFDINEISYLESAIKFKDINQLIERSFAK